MQELSFMQNGRIRREQFTGRSREELTRYVGERITELKRMKV